jgi:hypothetical protein
MRKRPQAIGKAARYEYGGRTEQTKAAFKRRADARALAEKERWRGAMYLGGYAVECRLKAKLMEMFNARTLDHLGKILTRRTGQKVELATHSIEYLFGFTGARNRLSSHGNERVLKAYRCCNTWTTSWRYRPDDGKSDECEQFLDAVDLFDRFIESSI